AKTTLKPAAFSVKRAVVLEMQPPPRIRVKGPEHLRRQLGTETKTGLSAAERLAASRPRYLKSSAQGPAAAAADAASSSSFSASFGSADPEDEAPEDAAEATGAVKRNSSKKRPDSLLLYRQKCDLLRSPAGGDNRRIQRREPLLRAPKNKDQEDQENGEAGPPAEEVLRRPQHRRLEELEPTGRRGVGRSHSDISSRYSKNFADFDAFFKFCGLDGEVVDTLGRENFSAHSTDTTDAKVRSVSVAASEDQFSRSSGDSGGLHEDEVPKANPTSAVERNARVIKWLYSCRNAAESGKVLRDLD
uniref:Family with sequence similarity 110 member C n=1 Tax=Denticeps clupeoides TaxID=299321 RepID=A0AAY4EI12_9TELE